MSDGRDPIDLNHEGAEVSRPGQPTVSRWVAATLCIVYGFAKLNGSQFTVLDSELSKPLGEVSGFWLTWYYFSYSWVYGSMLALLQIAAGVLLVIPRTALVGALMLLPIVTNIVLIDLFYGIDFGGTVAAIVLLLCVCLTIAPHVQRLRSAVLLDAEPRASRRALLGLGVIIVGACAFTWWVANYNNRAPSAIDGTWSVVAQAGTSAATPRWRTVYFERNRAGMVIFRSATSPDARHHFEVLPGGEINIWETWLTKGALIMRGREQPTGRIELDLGPDGGGHLTLQAIVRR